MESNSNCQKDCLHCDLIKRVDEILPTENLLYETAELFKILADQTRVKILFLLFKSEHCVSDITSALNMTQSAISHQLRVLKQSRLVKNRREGKTIYYSLADEHVKSIFYMAIEHIIE